MNDKKKREQVIINLDVNLALALVKCLSEHLHTMQWTHSQRVKQKFNKFLKVAKQYENEIDKSMHETNDETIENIYDALMDSIVESKQISIENYDKENNISN
tara:strand:- start:220 stop:525 length:306 start_codon:yes stop_codon:yes gene_type:complete